MPRSKRGPALIELIHAGSATGVPAWWQSADAPQPPSDTGTPADSLPTPTPTTGHPKPGEPAAPLATVRGERIVFSLSSVSAGVAVFILIVIVGLGFVVGKNVGHASGVTEGFESGKRSVSAGAISEIEAARRSAPNTEIFADLGSSPVTPNAAAAGRRAGQPVAPQANPPTEQPNTRGPWVRDHTYIVVQEFKSEDKDQAEAAKLFLHDHDVESVILESKGDYRYRLVATKGFNREDPAQRRWCDQYHAKIRELGNQFVKAGGRYDLQGYQKKLTGNRW